MKKSTLFLIIVSIILASLIAGSELYQIIYEKTRLPYATKNHYMLREQEKILETLTKKIDANTELISRSHELLLSLSENRLK